MDTLLHFKALLVGALFIVLFLLERWHRASPQREVRSRLIANGGLWVLNIAASALLVVPLSLFASAHPLWTRPDLPALFSIAVDLLILDFWIYWMHRAYHEIPFLWRFHEVHHLDEQLDSTSAVRFHFTEVVISASVRVGVIVLFAIPFNSVILFETLLLAMALFQHSNVKLPAGLEKGLSLFIVTPSIHWVHHHAVQADTDSNYCSGLSLWDRLFGTASPTVRWPEMSIGVEGKRDISLIGLIVRPFRKR